MTKCSNHPSNFPTAIHKAWNCKLVFSPWTECPLYNTPQCKLDCTSAVKSESNAICGDTVASHSGLFMMIIMTLEQKEYFQLQFYGHCLSSSTFHSRKQLNMCDWEHRREQHWALMCSSILCRQVREDTAALKCWIRREALCTQCWSQLASHARKAERDWGLRGWRSTVKIQISAAPSL